MGLRQIQRRKLIEACAISADTTFPFGIIFTHGQTHYTLNQASAGAGYVSTVTGLSQAFMALHNGGSKTFLGAGQLVESQGLFQSDPADCKTISASSGITIQEESGKLVLASTVDLSGVEADIADLTSLLSAQQHVLVGNAPIEAGVLPPNLEMSRVRNLFGVHALEVNLEPLSDSVSIGLKYTSPLSKTTRWEFI